MAEAGDLLGLSPPPNRWGKFLRHGKDSPGNNPSIMGSNTGFPNGEVINSEACHMSEVLRKQRLLFPDVEEAKKHPCHCKSAPDLSL